MKHCKRLLSMLTALVMLVSMLPTTALAAMAAEPAPEGPVTACLSQAHDDKFMEDANHKAVAQRERTAPYFNLATTALPGPAIPMPTRCAPSAPTPTAAAP